jgi:hypothetical protein
MPTQDRTNIGTTPGKRQPPAAPGEDKSEQDQRDLSSQKQRQNQPVDENVETPDRVEIGDPVPEDDRTIRARGETGEDEDLPPDDGDIEGSSSERH